MVARVAGAEGPDLVVVNRSGRPVATPEAWFDGELLWLRAAGAHGAARPWLADGLARLCVGEAWIEGRGRRAGVLTGRGCDVLT
jgi:hypothetical protein